MTLLEFSRVSAYYTDPSFLPLQDVSFRLDARSVTVILGTNGAGKSTVLKAVARQAAVASGEIRFDGEVLNAVAPHEICWRGIAYVPEGQRVWPNMTVSENLEMGGYASRDREQTRREVAWVFEAVPKLAALRHRLAYALSGGERQLVAIGRALVARPRCLLLDEPSLGLSPGAADQMFDLLAGIIRERHLAVLLVEQNCGRGLAVADRVVVMSLGRVALDAAVTDVTWEKDIEPLLLAPLPSGQMQ